MLAEIYLLQLELAANARESRQPVTEPQFVPFSLEALEAKPAHVREPQRRAAA
jgi:hypothetical protein